MDKIENQDLQNHMKKQYNNYYLSQIGNKLISLEDKIRKILNKISNEDNISEFNNLQQEYHETNKKIISLFNEYKEYYFKIFSC